MTSSKSSLSFPAFDFLFLCPPPPPLLLLLGSFLLLLEPYSACARLFSFLSRTSYLSLKCFFSRMASTQTSDDLLLPL